MKKIDSNNLTNQNKNNYTPRYDVECKAFKTGEWYTKTSTDNKGSAFSVARLNYGRAYRIKDNKTGEIIAEGDEDASMASCNGYQNG